MNLKSVLVALFVLGLAPSAFAKGDTHCKAVKSACKAAGFTKNGHKNGKGLQKDCVEPLLAGSTVEGVTVDSAEVDGCKSAKAKHHK